MKKVHLLKCEHNHVIKNSAFYIMTVHQGGEN